MDEQASKDVEIADAEIADARRIFEEVFNGPKEASDQEKSPKTEDVQASEGSTATDDPQLSLETSESTGEKVEDFTPNFTYKSFGEERDMEDWVKPFIKDSETEQKVRDLFEKSSGIDQLKDERERMQQSYQEMQQSVQQLSKLKSNVELLGNLAKSKDLNGVFNMLGIKNDDIFAYAEKEYDAVHNMTPEEKAAHRQMRDRLTEAEVLRHRDSLRSAQDHQVRQEQFREHLIHQINELGQEPVDHINTWEQSKGRGRFLDLVYEVGNNYFQRYNTPLAPEQAIKGALEQLRLDTFDPAGKPAEQSAQPVDPQPSSPSQEGGVQQPVVETATGAQAAQQGLGTSPPNSLGGQVPPSTKPEIPIAGAEAAMSGNSPIKPMPKTFEDYEKMLENGDLDSIIT